MTQWSQAFREGLEAHVVSTIADDIATKQKYEDTVEAQKIVGAQYAAELQAVKTAGELKCDIAAQASRAAWDVCSRAKKFRATALDNLEYDLRTHKE